MKINEMVHQLLDDAIAADNGRKAEIVVSDGPLRQTLIALRAGIELAPHNSPPAASILVLKGDVIVSGVESTPIGEGSIIALTHERHSVKAVEDSIFLLTTVTSIPGQGSHDGA
ncbi:cupin [Flaviflexus huanghaiensis]|uniref:cupin n=1 Tax=Flaviflexus huanghaiensis TaxID=1111473 RepID=UPI0015FCCB01|nr:cupin [Flaviflexus huanghaiensis]